VTPSFPSFPPFMERLQELLFHLLLLTALALAAWLSVRHVTAWDWSGDRRHRLAPQSLALLARLEAPLDFTVYAPERPPLRRRILQLLERYRRARPAGVTIRFVDPERHPDQARAAGVTLAGELLLEYAGGRERLRELSEETIGNALLRLLGRPDRFVAALGGHGERTLTGQANHDLGRFGALLEEQGYRITTLELARGGVIPDNLALLILAGPRHPPLAGEVALLRDYLERGGHLLWLLDPETPAGLEPLAEALGITTLPGRILDADVGQLGVDDPSVALVTTYPSHPATAGLASLTLFPGALALEPRADSPWQATPLLTTRERSWNETGPLQGQVRPDPERGERAGPLTLGLALERDRTTPTGARTQRTLVLGDGDFLSNRFLDNAGNRELGLRLVRWLAAEDALLRLPPPRRRDTGLEITRSLALGLGVGTLFVVPATLLLSGILIRRQRRRG
jgi:hypothetical protein